MNQLIYSMILGGAVIAGGCLILAASWHDLRATARRARLTAAARRLRGARQPLVAILIDARRASLPDLTASLDSVMKSRYRRLSICVVDAQPTPVLKQFVATYSQRYPTRSLRYYAPRRPLSQTNTLRLAYQRTSKHDLLLVLTAGDAVAPATIKQAAAHFSDNSRLGALQLARRSRFAYSLISLLQRYNEANHELLQKATPRLPRRAPSRIQTGVLYRHDYFMARKQRTARQTRYDASLLITSHAVQPVKTPRYPIFAWLLSAITIYLLTLVFMAAATLQSSSLLLLTWVSMCTWIVATLWTETATPLHERFVLTYGTLLTPLLTYSQVTWLVVLLPARAFRRLVRQWHRTGYNTYRHRYQRYVLDNILAFKAWYEWVCPRELWYQDQRRTDD